MDLDTYIKTMMAGGVLMVVLSFVFSMSCLALFLTALIHCVRHKHDDDRVTWVLIIVLVPLIGAILYFAMGRPKTPPADAAARTPTPEPDRPPSFDVVAMQDEKKRVQSINEALRAMGASSRRR